jgi:hypothetical protein
MGSGYKPFTAASVLTSADMNNYLMEQSVMFFATIAERDAAISVGAREDGMVAYIGSNDANEGLYTYNGTTWRKGPGWNAPWGMQLHAVDTVNTRDFTASPATIPNITGSVSVVANRFYRCTFTCRFLNTSASAANIFNIRAGGASVFNGIQPNFSTSGDQSFMVYGIFKSTTTGAVTFDVQANASAGTLRIYGANAPTTFTVEDCGPYGAPV